MNNRGISAVVATVLIILITVASVTIIWVSVVPMLKERTSFDISKADLSVDTSSGYTTYDAKNNLLGVNVRRGPDEINYSFIQIVVGIKGSSITYTQPAPKKNSAETFYFRLSNQPDSVKVAPIESFFEGEIQEAGHITSEVDVDKKGKISEEGKDITTEDGLKEDLECAVWNSEEEEYDYFNAGTETRSGDEICGPDGDYGECAFDANCTDATPNDCKGIRCDDLECVEYNLEAGVSCGGGDFCDGNGNCGECGVDSNCEDIFCHSKSCNSGTCEYSALPCTSEEFCIWDSQNKGCSADDDGIENLCGYGYTMDDSPRSKLIELEEESYINNMTFDFYYTCYMGGYDVFLNDVLIGSFETEDSSSCTCEPPAEQWPFTVYITNQELLNNNWNFDGENNLTIESHVDLYSAQSYYEMRVGYY